jgi:hypothetical protein
MASRLMNPAADRLGAAGRGHRGAALPPPPPLSAEHGPDGVRERGARESEAAAPPRPGALGLIALALPGHPNASQWLKQAVFGLGRIVALHPRSSTSYQIR